MSRFLENDEQFIMLPKNDFAFKMLFGDERNKDILIAFLNSVLNEKIEHISLLNTELKREFIEDKHGILDVRAVTDKGINIDIEIQLLKTKYMPERTLYYWSKMYIEQLKSGDKFSKLKKTITINILDYKSINSEKFHNCFHLLEDDSGLKLTDAIEVHFLEMPKLHERKDLDVNDNLIQWMMFLDSETKEGFDVLAGKNKEIEKAYNILQVISKDDEARAIYLAREMALHDEVTRLEEAEEKGIEKGLEKGRQESQMNIAKNLLNIGIDEESIAKATGLSEDVIKKIKQEISTIE